MRYSKVLKLGAVGLALLLIPRRSSRDVKGKDKIAADLAADIETKGQLKNDTESSSDESKDNNDNRLDGQQS